MILRYFNAVGADPEGHSGGEPRTRDALEFDAALGQRESFKILGTDYDTRDGTCVRAYIHVLDLSDAHASCRVPTCQR